MSPLVNITEKAKALKREILGGVRLKHRKLLDFGLRAYCLTSYRSVASNARSTELKFNTACRKAERFLKNLELADYLSHTLVDLSPIRGSSIINIDHTDISLLTALVGAIQTSHGRAIPCFVDTTYSHRIPSFGSRHSTARTDNLRVERLVEREQLGFMEHTIRTLEEFHERLGFWPRLAFDRGFGSIELIHYLNNAGAIFYIRCKADRIISDGTSQLGIKVKELKVNDEAIEIDGIFLRLVRSDLGRRCKEPWYILTNDFHSGRNKIVRIYYHRFEIEESFKDMKHLFELQRLRFNKPAHLKMMLLLVLLGFIILYRIGKTKAIRLLRRMRDKPKHPKKQLSWVREIWELWLLERSYRW